MDDAEFAAGFLSRERQDERFMQLAIAQARLAFEEGETPVGAVAVVDGNVVGRGHNRVEALKDPTAHAEIICLGAAATALEDWRLGPVTLYVTMEPCTMCAGAVLLSRLGRLVYGTRDRRAGACGTRVDVIQANPHGHDLPVSDGCLEAECQALLTEFFDGLRQQRGDAG
jgi:tRNA(adenine34) deaminase